MYYVLNQNETLFSNNELFFSLNWQEKTAKRDEEDMWSLSSML